MEQFLALLTLHGYSRMIAQMEKVDEHTLFITELAAYLHDIGVKISKEKYGNSQPQHQEAEGPIIAKDMLSKYDLPAEDVDASINLASHFIDEPKKSSAFFLTVLRF